MRLGSSPTPSSPAWRRPATHAGVAAFERMRTQGQTGPIEFEVYYREHENAWPITYKIAIETDAFGRP